MSKKSFCLLIFIVIILILSYMLYVNFSNTLTRSEHEIREHILTLIPIGTNMDETVNIIQDTEQWEIRRISYDRGYYVTNSNRPSDSGREGMTVIGQSAICASIGNYGFILETYVVAYFGFDENHRLIDVHIRKDVDSL